MLDAYIPALIYSLSDDVEILVTYLESFEEGLGVRPTSRLERLLEQSSSLTAVSKRVRHLLYIYYPTHKLYHATLDAKKFTNLEPPFAMGGSIGLSPQVVNLSQPGVAGPPARKLSCSLHFILRK